MAKSKAKPLSGQITINMDKDATPLAHDTNTVLLAAQQIQVVDDDSMNAAGEIVRIAAARIKAIKAFFKDDKSTSDKLHKSIVAKEKFLIGPYEAARELAEGKIKPYRIAQKSAVAEQEQELSEMAAKAKKDLLAQAAKLRKQGRMAEAQQLEDQAEHITAPILADMAPEVEGLSEREPWGFEVVDAMALIIAVAEGRVSQKHTIIVAGESREEDLIFFNPKVLAYLARTQTQDLDLPGVKAVKGLSFAVRGN